MMSVCVNCVHWKRVDDVFGECEKVKEKTHINLVVGSEGGYVDNIETEAYFGCNQFEENCKK
jgi:hypothetical protein